MSPASGLPVGDLPSEGEISVDYPPPKIALAVGAHPDDVEFGCGATLAKWADSGCVIWHLILTDGSKGTWDASDDTENLILTRQAEQREAARIIGETTGRHRTENGEAVTFLDYVDGELESSLEARLRVCEVIRKVKPDVVFGHDPWRRYRIHPDHRNAGWLVTDAVVAARDPKFFPETELEPHRPSAIFLFEADSANHVESVTVAQTERKTKALLAHRSQYKTTFGIDFHERDDVHTKGPSVVDAKSSLYSKLHAQMTTHGALAGVELGEAFNVITGI